MKRPLVLILAGFVAVFMCGVTVAQDAEKQQEGSMPEGGMPDMKEMMDASMKVAAPSKHHDALKQFVGTWNVETKLWWGGPGSQAMVSKGTSTSKLIFGGRFILEEVDSQFPMPNEKGEMTMVDFEGIGLTGYDNFRNMYTSAWADNMGTQMMVSKGAADPSGKKFTFYGEMDEPMLNVTGRYVKWVMKVINEDKLVSEMYDLHAGDDYKVMEITYTRKK